MTRVGVVGATGAVGKELLTLLEERAFPLSELRLFASERSAGTTLRFGSRELTVELASPDNLKGLDIALFSAGSARARDLAPHAVDAGAIVIDNSSAFRMDPAVPLVIPEINAAHMNGHRLIANPNCSTIILCMALAPLHRAAGIRRVIVDTYQAASGAGAQAMQELGDAVRARLSGEAFEPKVLPHSLGLNLFPHVDVFQADGYTKEEDKMLHETRKILDLPELQVEATCVRVPVERCHCEAVTVELLRALTPDAAREVLAAAPGVVVEDDPEEARFPQPIHVSGTDPVAVGRVRASRVFDPGLALWVVGDQLRKGAALNAIQIAESL